MNTGTELLKRYKDAVGFMESLITGPAEASRSPKELEYMRQNRLPRMAYFLEALGNPQNRFRAIHVGGTCGKGSTCAMVGAILRAAGYKVGVYTSPYLQTFVEKVAVGGSCMPPQDLIALVEWVKPLLERINSQSPYGPMAYTQLHLALALKYFALRGVDFAVVEVGMGGRYDYTNILSPWVAAITSVDLDHTISLGNTIAEIAHHKAGIIKDGIPIITGVKQREALDVIERECKEKGAHLRRIGREIEYTPLEVSPRMGRFHWRNQGQAYGDLEVSLLGEHQVENGAVAVGVADALSHYGVSIPEGAIREGLRSAQLPGRLEVVQTSPTVILDGAHNPEKARRLALALRQLFPEQPIVLVLGVLGAKGAKEITQILAPLARLTVTTATEVMGKPSTPPENLAEWVRLAGGEALCQATPLEAIELALSMAQREELVCVAGSLYLVGVVRERWFPTEAILRAAAQKATPITIEEGK